MSKCEKCKKGDMHFVGKMTTMNRGYNEYKFMCDRCGEIKEFKKII